MAIDTREKRFSMLNFGDGGHVHATFEADGTVDLDDRQHLLDCYSGIAFGGVIPLHSDAPVIHIMKADPKIAKMVADSRIVKME